MFSWRNILALSILAASSSLAADIPPGTEVRVRVGQTIDSSKVKSGDSWDGTLAQDLAADGQVIGKRGDAVTGKIVTARASGRLSEPGLLELQITAIGSIKVLSNSVRREGESHKGRNTKSAGGGAALGAIIGAVAGGGKGAAIGAGAGAAAGTAGAAATGKKDVLIPVETRLTFTIR